jgi:amylosucrase
LRGPAPVGIICRTLRAFPVPTIASAEETPMDPRAARSLDRLLPRLEAHFATAESAAPWAVFRARLVEHFPTLFDCLVRLYGGQYDFFYHLESILGMAVRAWQARPDDLRALDEQRLADPAWFQNERMLGGMCYVDRFAGTLAGLREKLPYLQEIGLTYLHLMPLFLAPEGDNDGGYAVSSYREVAPALGTMAELAELSREFRAAGISLVLDFVFNHTSDEHDWARRAQAGDPEYQDYYLIFPDRTLPDAYDRDLREIFPDQRQGSFSYRPDMDRWVWTTFNDFQWDLNYANPAVFQSMAAEMLFLANQGVEFLRLDAVVFCWKRLGTSSENLPESHLLVRAFNALARIAAPALLFKSEAIVHPDEVREFISLGECQISYNPLLMALLWNSLATREIGLLSTSLRDRLRLPTGCAWVNYVRSHDDIGWTFDDGDAARLGFGPYEHRRFLNDFYTGRFPGSFARGVPFQENPRTGDARISGTTASLAGIEAALSTGDSAALDLAIRRVFLIYGVAFFVGGIPLLYLGDEIGQTNDYGYRQEADHAGDSRWVHRPATDWAAAAHRGDPTTVTGRIYAGLHQLIATRRDHAVFAGAITEIIETGNPHVFGFLRRHGEASALILANFTEGAQRVEANTVRLHGLAYSFGDLVGGGRVDLGRNLLLAPYQLLCLTPR